MDQYDLDEAQVVMDSDDKWVALIAAYLSYSERNPEITPEVFARQRGIRPEVFNMRLKRHMRAAETLKKIQDRLFVFSKRKHDFEVLSKRIARGAHVVRGRKPNHVAQQKLIELGADYMDALDDNPNLSKTSFASSQGVSASRLDAALKNYIKEIEAYRYLRKHNVNIPEVEVKPLEVTKVPLSLLPHKSKTSIAKDLVKNWYVQNVKYLQSNRLISSKFPITINQFAAEHKIDVKNFEKAITNNISSVAADARAEISPLPGTGKYRFIHPSTNPIEQMWINYVVDYLVKKRTDKGLGLSAYSDSVVIDPVKFAVNYGRLASKANRIVDGILGVRAPEPKEERPATKELSPDFSEETIAKEVAALSNQKQDIYYEIALDIEKIGLHNINGAHYGIHPAIIDKWIGEVYPELQKRGEMGRRVFASRIVNHLKYLDWWNPAPVPVTPSLVPSLLRADDDLDKISEQIEEIFGTYTGRVIGTGENINARRYRQKFIQLALEKNFSKARIARYLGRSLAYIDELLAQKFEDEKKEEPVIKPKPVRRTAEVTIPGWNQPRKPRVFVIGVLNEKAVPKPMRNKFDLSVQRGGVENLKQKNFSINRIAKTFKTKGLPDVILVAGRGLSGIPREWLSDLVRESNLYGIPVLGATTQGTSISGVIQNEAPQSGLTWLLSESDVSLFLLTESIITVRELTLLLA